MFAMSSKLCATRRRDNLNRCRLTPKEPVEKIERENKQPAEDDKSRTAENIEQVSRPPKYRVRRG
jgi:hypothetical protein